jgi:glutamyl-Q tRNA(Asp) synthetase
VLDCPGRSTVVARQMNEADADYRGRFAPSPSGPLHFGSLVAAVGSYLQARQHRGQWLLRIEDLDTPRIAPGAEQQILQALETCGFEWDGLVVRQSERTALYAEALLSLRQANLAFECSCSRTDIANVSAETRYPGTCRGGVHKAGGDTATRFQVPDREVCFEDLLQGRVCGNVHAQAGDFVIRRRDRIWAYQLAVVADDQEQGITEVVRGCDLLDSTPRQILLQEALNFPTPGYAHLPLVLDEAGRKLSKSTQADALILSQPGRALWQSLRALRQEPPRSLYSAPVRELWAWALGRWSPQPLRNIRVCSPSETASQVIP